MSSDVIARVQAFAIKAEELTDKGHVLRAAEKFGTAAEAAHVLGEDNLVALNMRLRQSHLNGCFAVAPELPDFDAADSRTHAAKGAFITLLSGAVAALERRRVAGTLLDGKCAAAEEAWYAVELQRLDPDWPAAEIASMASLVGYEVFMRAAAHASRMVSIFVDNAAAHTSLHSFAQHAVHAAVLMQQPRRHSNVALPVETDFATAFRDAAAMAVASGHDTVPLVQQLAGAWQRLQRSGVLQARGVLEGSAAYDPEREASFIAAFRKSLNAPGLRTCALPGCGAKEAHLTHFKSCAACRAVVYCCREHQVAGWPGHKKACKAARKAAAAEEDDGAGPSGA